MKKFAIAFVLAAIAGFASAHPSPSWSRTAEGLPLEIHLAEKAEYGTVIFAHGCGGPSQMNQPGWSERLQDAGFNTVWFDSWAWRNVSGGVCATNAVHSTERVKEVELTIKWIKEQPWYNGGPLFVLGWSHGGGVAMASAQTKGLGIAKAAAVYPYCDTRYGDPVVPVQVHIGAADDWTPAYLCKNVFGFFRKNPLGEVFMYEGAYHAYDFFIETNSQILGITTNNQVAWRTQKSDPAARDLTIERVIKFFKN